MEENKKKAKVRVAILDDHQSTLDGYAFRLQQNEDIELVATASYGQDLEPMLQANQVDLLVLDVSVPISAQDPNPYPLLFMLPRLIEEFPYLSILVISMYKMQTLIKAVMEAGAKGYIIKDDREAILQLSDIILSVAAGGVFFSKQSYDALTGEKTDPTEFKMLTHRQQEALSLCAASPNMSTNNLAEQLNIASSTLRNLLSDAYLRLNVHNRAAAVAKARQLGLITPYPPEANI